MKLLILLLALNSHEKGIEAYNKEQYKEAKQYFTEAIKENPNNADLYYNRALTENKLKEYNEAEKDLKIAYENL